MGATDKTNTEDKPFLATLKRGKIYWFRGTSFEAGVDVPVTADMKASLALKQDQVVEGYDDDGEPVFADRAKFAFRGIKEAAPASTRVTARQRIRA